MLWIAGVDGCPGGWLSIRLNSAIGELCPGRHDNAKELILDRDSPAIMAIDIPIGLTEHGKRVCDVQARQKLGWPRRTSVFPPPARGVLHAVRPDSKRLEVSELNRRLDGRWIGAHAWGIVKKIKEVDDVMSADPGLQSRVREIHPEVSFWAWAGRPMDFRKKLRSGREERRRLIDNHFGPEAFDEVRSKYKVKDVGHDDILDAFAALWTAERLLRGTCQRLPEDPDRDSTGLRMEIVY